MGLVLHIWNIGICPVKPQAHPICQLLLLWSSARLITSRSVWRPLLVEGSEFMFLFPGAAPPTQQTLSGLAPG